MASVNDVIGSYRLIEELDRGGFGCVYRGEHAFLTNRIVDRIVAVKLMHDKHLKSQKMLDDFLQEARLLEKLKHPHILRIIDVSIHEGLPYLVAEYAPHGSLKDRIEKRSPHLLAAKEVMTILSQISEALHYAHQQNVVHRDLKPGNILFNAKGEALLADFGISIILDEAGTRVVDESGTHAYMAPEQFKKIVSKRSDQYALGCIAYELFTGQRPFVAFDERSQIAPTQLNPQLPIHIEQAILKAMAKDRKDRHADVTVFMTALCSSKIHKSTTPQTDTPNESSTQAPRTSSTPQKTKEQWLDEALAYHKARQHTKALAGFNQAIQLDPTFVHAYIGKGNTLRDLRRYEEALAAFDRATQLNHNYADVYNSKGNALESLKRYAEALKAYEQAILRDPNYAIAHYNKGNALKCLDRDEEALAAYERAIRLDPNNAIFHRDKGFMLWILDHTEEALAAYSRAIQLDPNDSTVYNTKGYILHQLKRYQEALVAYECALRLDPNDAAAYYNKGNTLHNLKRYQEALAAYDCTIELDPDNAYAWYSKGNTLKRLRWSEEAKQAYEQAKQLGYSG